MNALKPSLILTGLTRPTTVKPEVSLIESQKANLGEMMQNINEASARIDALSRRLEENPSLLLRPADPEPLPETTF